MSRYRRRGAVYELCWAATPYMHAGHYIGFAYPCDPARADPAILAEVLAARQTRITCRYLTLEQAAGVAVRIAQHRAGTGARLTAVIATAGIEFTVTRIWASATEQHEKALKDLNSRRKLCPACVPGNRAGVVIKPKRFRRPKVRRPVLAAA
jgi:hypothetical protein